jgi:hypothetical protein
MTSAKIGLLQIREIREFGEKSGNLKWANNNQGKSGNFKNLGQNQGNYQGKWSGVREIREFLASDFLENSLKKSQILRHF